MRKDRRALLAGLAVGVAGAGGVLWWVRAGGLPGHPGTKSKDSYAAWDTWRGREGDPARNLVRAGILASNPNNSQPWLFRVGPDRIEVVADPTRSAGPLDPYLREVHLGLGCAIENMVLAGPSNGMALDVRYGHGRLGPNMPSGPAAGPAAILLINKQSGASSPLVDGVPRRHTNRGPYDPGRAIPREALDAFNRMADPKEQRIVWLTEPERRDRFGALTVQATRTVLKHPTLVAAWQKWLRPDDSARQSGDGVPISTSLEDAGAAWVEATQMQVRTAPAIGALMLQDPYDLPAVLRAGRLWQRIHVEAARRGLAAQPLNQVLWRMEYEENLAAASASAPEVYALLNQSEWRPVHLFRLGYAKADATVTPRRPIDAVVLATS